MKYLLLICSDGVATPESSEAMGEHTPAWVQEMDDRGVRLLGQGLEAPATARTVRVRNGETLISDGPFLESKEFIGGFDVIECENLDEAIAVAAKHPVSWFHSIEVRPFLDYEAQRPGGYAPESIPPDAAERLRYMLMMCLDGVPESDEVEAAVMRDAQAWRERLQRRGVYIYGHALQPADTATTVRVRDGETLLSDGPFAESKEFLGGFALLSCESQDEAVQLAAEHPLASFHMIEVRRFWEV